MGKRIYNVDDSYFSIIDSSEKAYWLGILFSDGHNDVGSNTVKLNLKIEDLKTVENFKRCVNSESSIKIYPYSDYPDLLYCSLAFNSPMMCLDLLNLGMTSNKSHKLEFPNIKEEYYAPFIRGYFDGDGCVWEGKRKRTLVKDSTRKSGTRERIIHNVKITFTGQIDIITTIQNILISNLNFKKTKLNFSKKSLACTMEYSGRKQMKKLYDFMYKDCKDLYMERKKLKFESIIDCANIE